MSWIIITIVAYFILAAVNLGDKFLIEKVLPNSKVYAFLISILGVLVLVLAPWLLQWPGSFWLAINIGAGAIFPLALFFQFEALRRGDASRVTVIIGGLIPIFTTIGALTLLSEHFSLRQFSGMALLLIGTFIIAWAVKGQGSPRNNRQAFWFSLLAAAAYAVFFLGSKYAYNNQDFWSSFIWIRIGSALAALVFLIRPLDRREILATIKPERQQPAKKKGYGFLILINQAFGALGSILQNYALSFGSVAIINALQGVQYAFLLVFGWLISAFRPGLIKEDTGRSSLLKKALAIVLVSAGLYFII